MSTDKITPTDALITIPSCEDMGLAAKAAGLVDHVQLLRLVSIDAHARRYGTTDVTGISDDEFITHLFG